MERLLLGWLRKTQKGKRMKIQHSQEDYLEAILVLGKRQPEVRSVDISVHLGYTKASVSRAMKQLEKDGFVRMDTDKHIHLTKAGHAKAEDVYEKHSFFKEMLKSVGVAEPTASEDACKIEHAISDESFQAVKAAFSNSTTDAANK